MVLCRGRSRSRGDGCAGASRSGRLGWDGHVAGDVERFGGGMGSRVDESVGVDGVLDGGAG